MFRIGFPQKLTASRSYRIIELSIFILICSFPLWFNLNALAIRQWDEARNAVHTVEMLENHNYIVRHFDGEPEVWEPKPPLLIWLQVLSTHIFGINELAIRFPVLISSCLTVLLLIIYLYRKCNSRLPGYLAALVLVTSPGYIEQHVARTGDHDSLLILITTAIFLMFYKYLTTEKSKSGWLTGIAFLFILGVYTKSIAALFIVPGLFISLLFFGSLKKLVTDPRFYIALIVFIVITGSYYLLREHLQPGYLKAVWQWELFPRYANTQNNFNSDNFWFYARNFYTWRFNYWIWFLIPAFAAVPLISNRVERSFLKYILINAGAFFIVLSIGSKGTWYDGPLYPLFSMIIGLFLYSAYKKIKEKFQARKNIINALVAITLLLIFAFPCITVIKKVSRTEEYAWDEEYYSMCYLLRDNKKLQALPDPLNVVYEGYNAHILFYVKARNYEAGRDRIRLTDISSVSNGDTILISQPGVMDSISGKFEFRVLYESEPVRLVKISD